MLFTKKLSLADLRLLTLLDQSVQSWLLTVDRELSHELTSVHIMKERKQRIVANALCDILSRQKKLITIEVCIDCGENNLQIENGVLTYELAVFCDGAARSCEPKKERQSELTMTAVRKDQGWKVTHIQTGGACTSYDVVRLILLNKEREFEKYV